MLFQACVGVSGHVWLCAGRAARVDELRACHRGRFRAQIAASRTLIFDRFSRARTPAGRLCGGDIHFDPVGREPGRTLELSWLHFEPQTLWHVQNFEPEANGRDSTRTESLRTLYRAANWTHGQTS